jgi:hypothetical protein
MRNIYPRTDAVQVKASWFFRSKAKKPGGWETRFGVGDVDADEAF